MKSKVIALLLTVLLVVCSFSGYLLTKNKILKEEVSKYKQNTESLLSGIKRIQIDSTSMAVDVQTLKLTLAEYKRHRAEDTETIRKMRIQMKHLQAISKHKVEVNAPFDTAVKDTIIKDYQDEPVTAGVVKVETPHLMIDGILQNSRLSGTIRLPVVLTQAVWIEKKHKFLWWKWGVKAIHQTISSNNPYVEITYSEYIIIEK
ncbi:DUF6549 family protein [Bacteroides sp. 51]|uniref:DUF6549 family protein n=1 Tax=Bacteroides sp. 51 TaxID=2302938 RepID=UPI0013D2F260|nr:DUF6549 family protein [Bacteroides sp. 51]NDV80867.1 hypothetical protein [Bacteroides sp. 51]